MKLLFDQNLSCRLVDAVADDYPGSVHVRDVGLERADDKVVWQYAVANGLVIVSKDSDFHQRSFLEGHPPKVVWLRVGNCSTAEIEHLLKQRQAELLAFEADAIASFLALTR